MRTNEEDRCRGKPVHKCVDNISTFVYWLGHDVAYLSVLTLVYIT